MDILEEERDDFTEKMLKLLNYGGMMNFEVVNMFGIELGLIKQVELDENGRAFFHYNYFEDDIWEDAGYNSNTGKFFTNKVGVKEFCNAVLAAYTLYEFYDQTLGVTWLDAEMVGCTGYTAWINHLFGNQYTMERRVKYFFDLMIQAANENSNYKENLEEWIYDICPRAKEAALDKCDFIDLILIQMGTDEIDTFAENMRESGEFGLYQYICDIEYTVADVEKCKNELLHKAIEDSIQKAQVLTTAANVKLGEIQAIDYSWGEIDFVTKPMNEMRLMECTECEMSAPAAYDIDIEADDIDVTDTVAVVWEIS